MTSRLACFWLIAGACTWHNLATHNGTAWSNLVAFSLFMAVLGVFWRQARKGMGS